MVACKHCSTPNTLDSTFCKRCGTALPEEDVQLAHEKLTALVAEGNTAFNEGRTDEAMAIAQSACDSNPSSTAALSLKALCHERRGELAEALECADLIVDLNPDSELDKIKRNQLRTKLSVSVQLATQPPDHRSALVGAISAVVLMICIGIGTAKILSRNGAKGETVAIQNPVIQPSAPIQQTQSSAPNSGQPNSANNGGSTNRQQDSTNDSAAVNAQNSRGFRPGSGILSQPVFPSDGEIGLTGDVPVTPPNPATSGVPRTETATVRVPTPNVANDKTPATDDPAPKADDSKGTQVQNNDPGTIEIKLSSGHKANFGGTESLGAGGATALDKIGIQQYQLGSYGSAATSFEQALRAGGNQVTLNQWLARCYGNLGRKSDQVEAYKRCVTACQNAISSGTGSKDRIHAILDTCQQELKLLQGN